MSQHIAVFDPDAFYPFRSLVKGPLENWNELDALERFARAIVLHDNMIMVFRPVSYDPEAYEELKSEHPYQRNFITAMGPAIDIYDGLFSTQRDLKLQSLPDLAPKFRSLASKFSNAELGNLYYDAHIKFLQILLAVEKEGGSIVCDGEFASAMQFQAQEYPQELFNALDADWKEYARNINNGYHGPNLPPVLGIVLNRCKNRDDIPIVLKQLRNEWADPGKKVWELITELRSAKTLKEAYQIKRHLDDASKYFSPKQSPTDFSPIRFLWELFAEAAGGAIDAEFAGGNPFVGAATAIVQTGLTKFSDEGLEFAKILFRRGAFDLARRVRRETMKLTPMPALLSKFLTQAEKEKLGL
ncbi:MAG: hypothetical protein ACREOI_05605 [bacterium]